MCIRDSLAEAVSVGFFDADFASPLAADDLDINYPRLSLSAPDPIVRSVPYHNQCTVYLLHYRLITIGRFLSELPTSVKRET